MEGKEMHKKKTFSKYLDALTHSNHRKNTQNSYQKYRTMHWEITEYKNL